MKLNMSQNLFLIVVTLVFWSSLIDIRNSALGADNASQENCSTSMVEVYYVDWNLLVRNRLSADDVRENFMVNLEVRESHRIENLLKKVGIGNFSGVKSDVDGVDVRLVLDIIDCKGERQTIIADQFHLYTDDLLLNREIDTKFREAFDFFGSE